MEEGEGRAKSGLSPPRVVCASGELLSGKHTLRRRRRRSAEHTFFFKCCNCTHADGGGKKRKVVRRSPPLFLHYLFWGNELTFPGEGEKESWCAHFHFFRSPF